MRPISITLKTLLAAVRRGRGLMPGPSGASSVIVQRLEAIASQPEVAAVPQLVPLLVKKGDVARAAAHAIAACVRAATPDELLGLDQRCRQAWWDDADYRDAMQWRSLRPADVRGLIPLAMDAARVIGVVSFHPDGRVRETAVELLAELSGRSALPFLLIRLNDWVEPIAQRAERAVRQRLRREYADTFVDNLQIVLRLGAKRRRTHQSLVDDVLVMLLTSARRTALVRGLGSPDRGVRRILFGTALTSRSFDSTWLIDRALSDDDTVIRSEAARRTRLEGVSLERFLPRMLRDPYPAVRAEGIAGAAEHRVPDTDAILLGALLDQSSLVRETARFYLRRHRGFSEFGAFYRERLAAIGRGPDRVRVLRSAIAGLGEIGQSADFAVLNAFIRHAHPAVRSESARAIARVDFETALPSLLELLGDPSPIVTSRVRRLLAPRAGSVSPESLRGLIRDIPFAHGRLDALRLAMQLRKWDAITLLLESVQDPDVEMRSSAVFGIRRWIGNRNASFEQPTRRQVNILRGLVSSCRFALDAGVTKELEAITRYWDTSLVPDTATRRDA